MAFNVTILGCSSALPTSKRNPTAQVLNVFERFFLIDCGEGTQIQLRKFKFKLSRINHIFISHLHGDHYFGLFGLLSSYALMGRKNDIHIYADAQIEEIINFVLKNIIDNVDFKVIVHELNNKSPEIIYEDSHITIKSFPLKHRINTCGFLFAEKPKTRNIKKEIISEYKLSIKDIISIKDGNDYISELNEIIPNSHLTIAAPAPLSYAYCSDTMFKEENASYFPNVNLLFHESTFLDIHADRANDTYHSTAKQAAQTAKIANANKLILGHYSARYKDLTPILEEAQEIFQNTVLGLDGLTVEIE
ncbi:MAG TPA: ribonuclease Z [Bacteroidales bacterium]|nr:MAG: ribonuclease Z [Bacteroidetes bacterium GWF2_33_38]OFY68176.1 MAG: ribonuclease Z [Bacteroidetes bacterium RIFOXYA12_FULL_33_9]OFY92151.1 MAG: ribonuclease Z [Bacteroidetes bacterium RIFOXYA2_FULL_33_7]HBF88329.1 ribonuclease Z [Bacteroidales bacterium]